MSPRGSLSSKVTSCVDRNSPKRSEDVRKGSTGSCCDKTSTRQLFSTTSWIPPEATISSRSQAGPSSCSGSPRWMTFAKNPSPCPPLRRNSMEKKSRGTIIDCELKETKLDSSPKRKTSADESSRYQEMRKFSSPIRTQRKESNAGNLELQHDEGKSKDSPCKKTDLDKGNRYKLSTVSGCKDSKNTELASTDRSQRLSQRIRELYDFKTDTEWMQQQRKFSNPLHVGDAWISKSNSQEEKPKRQSSWEKENRNKPRASGRRNSQDLEFNDRYNPGGNRKTAEIQTSEKTSDIWREKPKKSENTDSTRPNQVVESTEFFKLSELKNKPKPKAIRSQEDECTGNVWNTLFRQRRTYSDEYDDRKGKKATSEINYSRLKNPSERVRLVRRETEETDQSENTPRPSYAEIDMTDTSVLKRNSRTSDVSYASIACPGRASFELNTMTKLVETPERRAFSQDDEPTFPLIPRKTRILTGLATDSSNNAAVAGTNATVKTNAERKKRSSTRYKVYLT